MSRPTVRRVLAYLRHHGPLRGLQQLFSVYRQLHELRLGDFKGRDAQGNEFYEDRHAPLDLKRRFVLYANSQRSSHCHTHMHTARNDALQPHSSRSLCRPAVLLQTRTTTRATSVPSGTDGCIASTRRRP